MGAVMGSKNLKAVVVEGTQPIPLAYPEEMKQLAVDGYKEVLTKPLYISGNGKALCQRLSGAKKTVAFPPSITSKVFSTKLRELAVLPWRKSRFPTAAAHNAT